MQIREDNTDSSMLYVIVNISKLSSVHWPESNAVFRASARSVYGVSLLVGKFPIKYIPTCLGNFPVFGRGGGGAGPDDGTMSRGVGRYSVGQCDILPFGLFGSTSIHFTTSVAL